MPAARCLEDVAFYQALVRVDAKFRHSPAVRVTTAARLEGRAEVGFAWQLRQWREQARQIDPQLVDCGGYWADLFNTRARLRGAYEAAQTGRRGRLADSGVDTSVPFGQWLEDLHFSETVRERWPDPVRLRPLRSVLFELRERVRKASRVTGEAIPVASPTRSRIFQ